MLVYLRNGICWGSCTCCRTETEVADQTVCLTQSQYTDTGPTGPCVDPITPGAWLGNTHTHTHTHTHTQRERERERERERDWAGVPILKSLVCLDPQKDPRRKRKSTQVYRSRGGSVNHLANEAVDDSKGKVDHSLRDRDTVLSLFFYSLTSKVKVTVVHFGSHWNLKKVLLLTRWLLSIVATAGIAVAVVAVARLLEEYMG